VPHLYEVGTRVRFTPSRPSAHSSREYAWPGDAWLGRVATVEAQLTSGGRNAYRLASDASNTTVVAYEDWLTPLSLYARGQGLFQAQYNALRAAPPRAGAHAKLFGAMDELYRTYHAAGKWEYGPDLVAKARKVERVKNLLPDDLRGNVKFLRKAAVSADELEMLMDYTVRYAHGMERAWAEVSKGV